MQDNRFIRSIRLANLLSFGPDGMQIELRPLNVLIGPNASGKSNFIEAISLLKSLPVDLQEPLRRGGGAYEWLWKGEGAKAGASLDVAVGAPSRYYPAGAEPIRHYIGFGLWGFAPMVIEEFIEDGEALGSQRGENALYSYSFGGEPSFGGRQLSLPITPAGQSKEAGKIDPLQSILAQRRDPGAYPQITRLAWSYSLIRMYREWNLSRSSVPRLPQRSDEPGDFLLEDARNLGMVLNHLESQTGNPLARIEQFMRECHPGVQRISTKVEAGTVQVLFHEKGFASPVPAIRVSDGMLRYLCLLTVLLHPSPPPLICVEEPEIGLHPDVLHVIGKLLKEAATRTQLIVTTHSDLLVSELSDTPESVIICERDAGGTLMHRLDPDKLKDWLSESYLGHIWLSGELGGTL
jgi:predicted ATPase